MILTQTLKYSRCVLALRYLLLAPLLVLQGCQTLDKPVLFESIEQRQASLQLMQQWQATGRIALTSADSGFSAAMDWQQASTDYDVTLTAVLGQRALKIAQQGQSAVLSTRGNASVSGSDAELLLLRELGVRVPLRQFGFWLRGLPGQSGVAEYDAAGRLSILRYTDQDGTAWVAKFVRYQRVSDRDLPALIDVQGSNNKIKVSIKKWAVKAESTVPAAQQTTPQTPSTGRLQIPGA